jgi:haloalkane dehalogenase
LQPLRTPDECFLNLPDYDFAPHYVTVPDERFNALRMHYLDEGARDGHVILLLHGQGCWSYLYRRRMAGVLRTSRAEQYQSADRRWRWHCLVHQVA